MQSSKKNKKESWQTRTGRLETATTTTTFHQWQQQGTCAANPSRIHFNIKRSEHYLNQYLNIFKQRVHLFRTKTNTAKHRQTATVGPRETSDVNSMDAGA
jgi:hypothetical protein